MSVATWPFEALDDRQRLQQAPEIPVLIAATNAVDLAIAVLRIQHPFLKDGDAVDSIPDAVPVFLAEVVRLHALALRAAIERYRDNVKPFPRLPGDNDDDDYF